MTNKELAGLFKLLGDIMELHDENVFKIRSYKNAYMTLRKMDEEVIGMEEKERAGIKGIGKAINAKISELAETGKMSTLERYKSETPAGIIEMLAVKGLGPKKIRVIWKDLEVESIGELLYAINENRLIELNGFGAKTQADLKNKLEYYLQNVDNYHFAVAHVAAMELKSALGNAFPAMKMEFTGDFGKQAIVVDEVNLLVDKALDEFDWASFDLVVVDEKENEVLVNNKDGIPFRLSYSPATTFGTVLLNSFDLPASLEPVTESYEEEKSFFDKMNWTYLPAAARQSAHLWQKAQRKEPVSLIDLKDIKGVVHNHSTYSDGVNSMEEMLLAAKEKGYSYMLMTDHSKSAFYANGLKEDRLEEQWKEIDALNEKYEDFKLLKGIESDILSDGSLDYSDDVLARFDTIIASVHSNLRMDEEKANQRLVKAIENPYTHILGHPTGRLLLSRPGYPIDHELIIDACAANGVHIELNANPWRLDLDPVWIAYAMEKGVMISINPDAHSTKGIDDIKYGVFAAQSGGLTTDFCLNALDAEGFLAKLKK